MVKSSLGPRARFWLRMSESAALGATAVILLVFLASSLDGLLIRGGQGAAVITAMIVDLTNTDRGQNRVGELSVSPTLTAIAQAKANDMALKGYFAHNSPEGHDPWYWFKQGGYLFSYAGENLAVDFSDSADVERAWMNSPTHRANLLNGNFTEVGVATAVGTYKGHETTFVVQEFGTPAHAATSAVLQTEQTPSEPTEVALASTIKPATKPAPAKTLTLSSSSAQPVAAPVGPPEAVLGSAASGIAAPASAGDTLGLTALWNVFAASPRTTLRYAYYLFGLLILIALVIETGIEIRRHHMRHLVAVIALLVLMSGLFLVADTMIFTTPTITNSAGSANAG